MTIKGKGTSGKPESPIQGSRGNLDNGTGESYREMGSPIVEKNYREAKES